jgi:predicted nucleic acid-binding protein
MRVCVDTNVLLRSIQPDHVQHRIACDALAELSDAGHRLVMVSQVVYELYVVLTRPGNQYGGFGRSVAQALQDIDEVRRFVDLLPDSQHLCQRWLELVEEHNVAGKRAHDFRLVAAMQLAEVNALLTFNGADFRAIDWLDVLSPDALSTARAKRSGTAPGQ